MSKTYYKKDDPTKIVTIVDDKQPGYYELSNGQMIKKDIFGKYYIPQENVSQVNESFKPINLSTSDKLDPNSFFTTPALQLNQKDLMNLKNADPSKGAVEGADRTEFVINTADKTKGAVPILNEKVRQPLTQNIPDMNGSIVMEVDETTLPIPNNTHTDVSQYRVFENEDDAYADFVNKGSNPQPTPQPKQVQQPKVEVDELYENEKLAYGLEEANLRKDKRLRRNNPTEIQSTNTQQPKVEQKIQEIEMNPSEMMFKTFKRNHDIKINVEFTDKIGKPEFIKMMMENMDGDIVAFYKKLIVDNIRNNFKTIEDEVENQIRKEIFGYDEDSETIDLTKLQPDTDLKKSIEIITKLSKQIIDKSDELSIIDNLNEEEFDKATLKYLEEEEEEKKLIPGGTTPAGKQLYKFIDEKGAIRESLPRTANKKGWKPLTK